MSYTSLIYYVMVIVLLIIYYAVPKRFRWLVLLSGSIYFYTQVIQRKGQIALFLLSIIISYLAGLILQKMRSTDHSGRIVILYASISCVSCRHIQR